MLSWLFIFYVCFFPQILGALWTWHGIRWANTCVVGTQLRAVSEHSWQWATRGSPQSQRNTTQLRTQAEATTGSRFQMCHGGAREGEKKERKEGKPRKCHRGEFTTDCTSVEEFPPRHCREVVQKTSEKGNKVHSTMKASKSSLWVEIDGLNFPRKDLGHLHRDDLCHHFRKVHAHHMGLD